MTARPHKRGRVLVIGVVLEDMFANAQRIMDALADSHEWVVDQRWMTMGVRKQDVPPDLSTTAHSLALVPKFEALNELLTSTDATTYDFILVIDDDVSLEAGWLDRYLTVQTDHRLSLAQPARTWDSFIDHPFTAQLPGIQARETRFVEIGPVISIAADAFEAMLPFDTEWPMGWGLDLVWPETIASAGLKMGIIDSEPVGHASRAPQSAYAASPTREVMEEKLTVRRHLPLEEAQVIVTRPYGGAANRHLSPVYRSPSVSVVLATRDRASMLSDSLQSLAIQTLAASEFEVVIIDDGSTDDTPEIVASFGEALQITYRHQAPSGLAAARNHGLFVSSGSTVVFLDDDDTAEAQLLEAHLLAHQKYTDSGTAILGYTGLGGRARHSTLMKHIVGRGRQMFSYEGLPSHQPLDFMHFWGGRASAKRRFLLQHGTFDTRFTFGAEDIELGYRLSAHGFNVVYVPEAVSWMQRELSWEQFLTRTFRQGQAYRYADKKHPGSGFPERLGLAHALKHRDALLEARVEIVDQVGTALALADDWHALGLETSELASIRIGALIDTAYWATLIEGFESSEPVPGN